MRISYWSSDVCSSDLEAVGPDDIAVHNAHLREVRRVLQRLEHRAPELSGEIRVVHHAVVEGHSDRVRREHLDGDWPRDPLVSLHGNGSIVPGSRPSAAWLHRSEEHTSELQSLMRISYAVFC